MGVLFDATLCVGCRSCEWACKEEHSIPPSDRLSYQDRGVFKDFRKPPVCTDCHDDKSYPAQVPGKRVKR